jgi:hypothetical protein
LGLLWQYYSKWDDTVGSVAQEIRLYNARNDLDQSVDKEDLARDYLIPYCDSNLRELAQNNGKDYHSYQTGLHEGVAQPKLFWAVLFHILGLLYTFSGVTYLLPGGFISGPWFLASVIVLFLVSLGLFFTL